MTCYTYLENNRVNNYLAKQGYTILSTAEILNKYFNFNKTKKDLIKELNCTKHFLNVVFAVKDDKELQELLTRIQCSLMFIKNVNSLKFGLRALYTSSFPESEEELTHPYAYFRNYINDSAIYFRNFRVATRIITKVLLKEGILNDEFDTYIS